MDPRKQIEEKKGRAHRKRSKSTNEKKKNVGATQYEKLTSSQGAPVVWRLHAAAPLPLASALCSSDSASTSVNCESVTSSSHPVEDKEEGEPGEEREQTYLDSWKERKQEPQRQKEKRVASGEKRERNSFFFRPPPLSVALFLARLRFSAAPSRGHSKQLLLHEPVFFSFEPQREYCYKKCALRERKREPHRRSKTRKKNFFSLFNTTPTAAARRPGAATPCPRASARPRRGSRRRSSSCSLRRGRPRPSGCTLRGRRRGT